MTYNGLLFLEQNESEGRGIRVRSFLKNFPFVKNIDHWDRRIKSMTEQLEKAEKDLKEERLKLKGKYNVCNTLYILCLYL